MSKRRSLERGAGETSGRASKLQCPGISGNNAKRAGPFILGKETTSVCANPESWELVYVAEIASRKHLFCEHVIPYVCVCQSVSV